AEKAPEGVSVSPSSEVRQGQEAIKLSYGRTAGGLASPSHVDLQDLVVSVDSSSTDDHLLLTVSVPHGALPGPRTLSFDTASGTITEPDAVEVTFISSGPEGNDSQLGTTSSPFRSLKQALLVAGPADTCLLKAGTYDEQDGETWGYAVPEQLTIMGDAASTTLLQAPAHVAQIAPASCALQPGLALALRDLTLADFNAAVNITQTAELSARDVAIRGNGEGIVVGGSGSTVKLVNGSIASAAYAIELGATCDGCALDINGSTLTESGDMPLIEVAAAAQHSVLSLENAQTMGGIFVADAQATISIDGGTLEGNGDNAALNFAGVKLDAKGATFTAGSSPYGINLKAGVMTLTDVTVHGNQYGVYQLAGTSKVRGTKIDGYASIGLYFASGDLDLGTATEAGDDSFVGAAPEAFGLYVDTNTSPLTCSNVSFDGVVPKDGTVQAGTDLLTQPDEYILTPGKTISFYNVP
ncbi:MAG TPA: DUF1565 domain-containing protein, partial [Polyangiaceae bacterium]|nr:DUF1565 domain-containing protein [Polyangiaceae bacterium]